MDDLVSAELSEGSAFLTTARGEVYRIWCGSKPYPFIERLTPSAAELYKQARDKRSLNNE